MNSTSVYIDVKVSRKNGKRVQEILVTCEGYIPGI